MIAEDLALLRDGLTRLLRDNGFDVVEAVADGEALVGAVLLERPDVAIVDIRLPPTFRDEGVRAALTLRERAPETGILIVSQYVEQAYASELLADGRGGLGYLLKDRIMDVDDFVAAVSGSAPAAPRSTRRWSPSCSRAAARTARSRPCRRASSRCCR